ncbi:MAG: hypothetical protein IPK17_01650 [Chloroflexi bacterium]|uniref:hypothetical protein n=1 Tax=Candidatus Flexifilum breve TaxID=3140694 RepID=UPI003134ABC0|nr:hypothetical protein [Chloroflexota bacterium]
MRLNERLIEVRNLLREMDSVDPDLHGQLYLSYEVMRTQVLTVMGVELEPELLV